MEPERKERMTVASVNVAAWPSPGAVRRASRRGLRPVEAALLARHRAQLSGRVLEIGSRGDGLTEALEHRAGAFTGLGFSTPEIDLCRARYQNASFAQLNLGDLEDCDDGEFDAVVAGRYALDRLDDASRRQMLACLARILADDGVLIFSSHNLARESLVHPPLRQAARRPWTLGRLPRSLRNRALLSHLQDRAHGYAILNDSYDAYGRLSYFISREHQERQLSEHDLSLLDCVDRHGHPVGPADAAYRECELHYVAQPDR